MKAAQQLLELGQSLWLDNITRTQLTSGALSRYIREFTVTGLTSNPTIFDQAIKSAGLKDDAMRTYKAYRDLLASPPWKKLAGSRARPQRLLWASTGTKDPAAE